MKKTFLIAAIGALALGVHAGDWGKAPIGKAPIEECVDLGGSISVGYQTDFFLYGAHLAGDSVTANVNYTIDGLAVPVTLGAFYVNGITNNRGSSVFDALNLSATAKLGTFAGFDTSLAYSHFIFPEFRSNVSPVGAGFGDLTLGLRRDIGFADAFFRTNYAMGGFFNGWNHEVGLEKTFNLTDNVNLVVGAAVAYTDNYFNPFAPNGFTPRNSGWSHYSFSVSLPIQLNCRTTLTPYIGYIGAPDTWVLNGISILGGAPQSDMLHGGVTLSVAF